MFLASKAKNTQEAQIVIDNEEIECTSSLTLSGVLIDNKLRFGVHAFNKAVGKQIAKLVSSRGWRTWFPKRQSYICLKP